MWIVCEWSVVCDSPAWLVDVADLVVGDTRDNVVPGGVARVVYAVGSSNALVRHAYRGFKDIELCPATFDDDDDAQSTTATTTGTTTMSTTGTTTNTPETTPATPTQPPPDPLTPLPLHDDGSLDLNSEMRRPGLVLQVIQNRSDIKLDYYGWACGINCVHMGNDQPLLTTTVATVDFAARTNPYGKCCSGARM